MLSFALSTRPTTILAININVPHWLSRLDDSENDRPRRLAHTPLFLFSFPTHSYSHLIKRLICPPTQLLHLDWRALPNCQLRGEGVETSAKLREGTAIDGATDGALIGARGS
jgi:hypothetical protein